jgi:Zn-dependent protease with chaperone function
MSTSSHHIVASFPKEKVHEAYFPVHRDQLGGAGTPRPQMQAFGINTGETGGFMRLFMSHPPLEAQIAALRSPNASHAAPA